MADRRYEQYFELTNGDTNAIRVSVYYNLGGYNMFTYKPEKRGYYLSITPCNLTRKSGYNTIETSAFSGFKMLIKELKRDSNKAYEEAIKFAEKNMRTLFKTWFPNLETEWKPL